MLNENSVPLFTVIPVLQRFIFSCLYTSTACCLIKSLIFGLYGITYYIVLQ